ncbi:MULTISPECIES: asparagine synthase-related protein [Streptomyces]|uniref:asparagine synthase-related protein n=1 Tax=Streptomyces TaxID=1883 RepID=UPI00073DD229|nr:asparagine synthase-related protein [Streptomyces sp. EAS-AB2608]BCM64970.1 putative asparagine synthase [Streptomyces sp. EAS-AB2608]CUW32877.1 Asparagine synthase [Streptomyces reticuli]
MENWWVMLPDSAAAAAVAGRLCREGTRSVLHASGRPWLVGRWDARQEVSAQAGEVRVVVLGRSTARAETLRRRIERVRRPAEAERAVAGLPGSFHLLASVAGRVWARGTASAARRVFTTRVAGVPVAADRADVLAALSGADPDPEMLALRLLHPPVTSTVHAGRTYWRTVHAVPAHQALVWERDGRPGPAARWWSPPEPHLSLPEAAAAVRIALTDAVGTCTAGGGTVSADLSGGLDSTSLCFLAARGAERLVTVHWEGRDPDNDDAVWAARARAALPSATHLILTGEESPDWFAGVGRLRLPSEEPCAWVRDFAKQSDLLRRVAGHGSRLHLSGGGGDELFTPFPSYLQDLAATQPLRAWSRLRRQRHQWRAGRLAVVRGVLRRTSYRQWLLDAAGHVARTPPSGFTGMLGWQPEPRAPSWATPEAVATMSEALRTAAADSPEPLAPQRSVHCALQQVREGGNTVRVLNQTLTGPPTALPYTDDAVVTAALSVRPLEAVRPGTFKPLLSAALTGLVPAPVLARPSKGAYDADFYHALRRHRGQLLALTEDSLLARAGLIDAERLRRALHFHAAPAELDPLPYTVGCEVWLRSLQDDGPGCAPHLLPEGAR